MKPYKVQYWIAYDGVPFNLCSSFKDAKVAFQTLKKSILDGSIVDHDVNKLSIVKVSLTMLSYGTK